MSDIVNITRTSTEINDLPITEGALYIVDNNNLVYLVVGENKVCVGHSDTDFVFKNTYKTQYAFGPFKKNDIMISAGETFRQFLAKFGGV